jgi:hypothetical protein
MLYFCNAWHLNYLAGDDDVYANWTEFVFRGASSHAGADAIDAIEGKFR